MEVNLNFFEAQGYKSQGFKVTQLTFDATSLQETELYLVEEPSVEVSPFGVSASKLAVLLPGQLAEFTLKVGMPFEKWPSPYLSSGKQAEEVFAWLSSTPAEVKQKAENVLRKMAPGLF